MALPVDKNALSSEPTRTYSSDKNPANDLHNISDGSPLQLINPSSNQSVPPNHCWWSLWRILPRGLFSELTLAPLTLLVILTLATVSLPSRGGQTSPSTGGPAATPSIKTTDKPLSEATQPADAAVAGDENTSGNVFNIQTPEAANSPPVNDSLDGMLAQVRKSLNTLNYEASFIIVKGKFAEPYEWAHGIIDGKAVEYLRSLNGANSEVVRKDGLITYFDAESAPYSTYSRTIEGILPPLFFDSAVTLGDHYSIAIGGKSRVLDRVAQFVRIVAKDEYRYNYWLWIDVQSSLILKSAMVSPGGDVLEQFQVTRINVLPEVPGVIRKLQSTDLPVVKKELPEKSGLKWRLNWLPIGFRVVTSNQHQLNHTGEVTDYLLLSDGLVELSVFIQAPLGTPGQGGHVRNGPNVISVFHGNGFDVSVIGKIPLQTAERIAQSITRD